MDDELLDELLDEVWTLIERRPRQAVELLRGVLHEGGLDEPQEADVRHALGSALEETGDRTGMIREWLIVRQLDERADPPQTLLPASRFGRIAESALSELPAPLLRELGNVAVLVDDRPSEEMVRDGLDPRILGLYTGIAMPDQSTMGGGAYPEVIHLFQRNLEAEVDTPEELAEQIRITVIHETAHYFGFDDGQLRRMGLG